MADLHVKGSLNMMMMVYIVVMQPGLSIQLFVPETQNILRKKWLGLAKQYGMETNIFDTS